MWRLPGGAVFNCSAAPDRAAGKRSPRPEESFDLSEWIGNTAIAHVVIDNDHGERYEKKFKSYDGWAKHFQVVLGDLAEKWRRTRGVKLHKGAPPTMAVHYLQVT